MEQLVVTLLQLAVAGMKPDVINKVVLFHLGF